jgi:hypothetical protein
MVLVRRESAGALREELAEMVERLVQGISLVAGRCGPFAAQKTSQRIESHPQASDDAVDRLQRKRQTQSFRGGPDRRAVEQFAQQRPQQSRRERMARQNTREEQREGFTTTPALAPVGAKYPLPAHNRTVHHRRIVAAQHAVAVERAAAPAMRTAVPLERKSTALNAS